MRPVSVTDSNNAEIANRIISELKDCVFDIVTNYVDPFGKLIDQKVLRELKLKEDLKNSFIVQGRLTKILLSPSRSILWDLSCEVVMVDFQDNNVMVLERIFSDKRTILRTVIYRPISPT